MGKKFAEYSQFDLSKVNAEVLKKWDENQVFAKSMTEREGCPSFVFYEGPPSANGMPGIHHVMARSIKDIFCRYKTMKGFLVKRKAGWDTHGLPVELGVEKAMGITKEDIGNGPERIVRRGDEHLVSVIKKPLHGKRDQFAHAVSGEDIIHADIRDALFLAVVDDRAAGAHEAMGIGVALGVGRFSAIALRSGSGVLNPKWAGFPMFSFITSSPARIIRFASSIIGPRMS